MQRSMAVEAEAEREAKAKVGQIKSFIPSPSQLKKSRASIVHTFMEIQLLDKKLYGISK